MDRRVLWIGLFASLALNVFVVGAFVGARLTRVEAPASPAAAAVRARSPVIQAVRTLSPDSQAAWRAQNRAFAQVVGPDAREARRLARETLRGLGGATVDTDAAIASLEKARALEHASRTAMDRRLVAFAASLPPEERARFAEALARPPLQAGGGR